MATPSEHGDGAVRSAAARLDGVMAACLTPFDVDGSVDFDALERQIEFVIPDADAVTVGAVESAEYTVLDLEQRKDLLRQAARMIGGRRPLILGASAAGVRMVGQLAELAADVGADFVQVLAPARPWGGEPSADELLAYYSEVAALSPLPIVAYHNPLCGADPSVELWTQLAEIPAIAAIKESSRNISKIGRMIEAIDRPGTASYFTTMQPMLATLEMGGSGSTMPPPGTRIAASVLRAYRAGDDDRARAWQRLFHVFPAAWSRYGLPPVMKAAMRHFGVDVGEPARPYATVNRTDDEAIGLFLRETGVLDGAEYPDPEGMRRVTTLPPTPSRASGG